MNANDRQNLNPENKVRYFLPLRWRRSIARRWGLNEEFTLFDLYSRRVAFTVAFSGVGIFILVLVGIIYIVIGKPQRALIDFALAIATMANLRWVKVGRIDLATGTILGLMLALSAVLLVSGGLSGTGFLWLLTVPLLALFLEGAGRGLRWTLGGMALILSLLALEELGLVQTAYSRFEFFQITLGFLTISVLVFVFETITERYEGAWQRQEHELKRFKQATDSAADGIVMTDYTGSIVYVNDAWQQLTGYASSEVIGKNPNILQSGKTPSKVFKHMWAKLLQGKSFITEEIINRRKDGREYQAQLEVFPIQDERKNLFYVGLEQDISERKAIDRAKTEFVSLASHQLTTPLSALSWFTELLASPKAGPLTAQQRHLLNRVGQSTTQMVALVNALLNVSRIDLGTFSIKPEPVTVQPLVNEMVAQAKASATNHPKIIVQLPKRAMVYRADPVLFQIILQNLLTNAIRYTPLNGTVTIKVARAKTGLTISVADTGIGIPPEQQEKIFRKLFRATNASERVTNGNGLGLYMVKGIVEQSGGRISFSSTVNRGTTFTVVLPASGMKKKTGNRQLSFAGQA